MNNIKMFNGYRKSITVLLVILIGCLTGILSTYPILSLFLLGGIIAAFFCWYIYNNPEHGLIILFIGFLINPMIISKIIPSILHLSPSMSNMLGMWKEGVLFILALRVLSMKKEINKNAILTFATVLMLFSLIYIFVNQNFIHGIMGYRFYFETMTLFFVVNKLEMHKRFFQTFIRIFSIFVFLMAAWSLVVSLFLGYQFMFDVGYTNYNGVPHFSYLISGHLGYLRTFGTLSAPNNYGLFVDVSIMLLLIFKEEFKNKLFLNLNLLLQVVVLSLTYSRSAWIGLLIALFIYFITSKPNVRFKFILFSFYAAFSFLIYCVLVPDNPVVNFFINTVTLRDTSAMGHLNSWAGDIKFILSHPLGIGLGNAGPKAFELTGIYLNPEISFYTVAYEMGILGMVLFFIFNVFSIIYLFKKSKKTALSDMFHSKLYLLSGLSWLIVFMSYFFLPMVQEMEVTLIPYFMASISLSYKKY